MTPGLPHPARLRAKLIVPIAGPLLVLLASHLAIGFRTDDRETWNRREQRLHETFETLLVDAGRIASAALRDSPATAIDRRGAWGGRLEGVGILDPELRYVAWEGRPGEPSPSFGREDWPAWTISIDGVHTRLVVRDGPDAAGRLALASFIIDSKLEELAFDRLLPTDVRRGARLRIAFKDSAAQYGDDSTPRPTEEPASERDPPAVALRAPSGEILAAASLAPRAPERRAAKVRRIGRACAAVLFLALLAAFVEWTPLCRRGIGLLATAGVLAVSRWILIWQEAPARLLPRELGSPSLYGSSLAWDLLASPADLLLTALALYLFCIATRNYCIALAGASRPAAMTLAGAVAAGTTAVGLLLTFSLARNSRIPLLERPAPFEWDGRLLLWLGLLLALLAAAEIWALLASLVLRRQERPGRLPVAAALVLLVAGSGVLLQDLSRKVVLEQLRSEFASQILEQGSRRRFALQAAMGEIRESYALADALANPTRVQPEILAYRFWVGGELFHSGYKSSLDFYSPDGELISHFGFDLPPLAEPLDAATESIVDPIVAVKEEVFEGIGIEQKLLHAEVPIVRGGEILAVVVGHVLDEPSNLPFLPASRPYHASLGPGSHLEAGYELLAGGPHYVLYDRGAVDLTTLRQPPAETAALREAAARDETITVVAGDESYVGLALAGGDRLHLLLMPTRTAVEHLAAAVRLSLLGLLLLAALTLIRVLRPGGPRALYHVLRGSFYRKLVAALLFASILPLVGLALFLQGYIERRGDASLVSTATQFVGTAQQVVEDYSVQALEAGETELNDGLLYWLRGVVGQEIHVYEDGLLAASSKRELFDSGLLPRRLDGLVQQMLVGEGLPSLVVDTPIGAGSIPVAYAPVRLPGYPRGATGRLVVAVPLVLEQQQIAQATSRVAEMILLATVVLVGLLAVAAAVLARTVARPVRDLVDATGQIAAGRYSTRLEPRTGDEVAELVKGFNTMASALGRQRADIERRRDYIETLLRHATTAVVSLDTEGHVVTLNPAATALLAPAADELRVGAHLTRTLDGTAELQPLASALRAGKGSGAPVEVDLVRGQQPRRIRAVRVELRKASGESFGEMILLDDVTDLMRSNQLAAWAEMARAIAHEIKNPLTPIQLSTEHLQRLLRDRGVLPSSEEEACLETIIKQVRALYGIAGEFSTYAKLPDLAPESTDPVEFMREAIAPYRASKPAGVSIEERYAPTPAVAVDRRVLSRAVINLVENALQAMPQGGTLTVAVAADRNGGVELSVADTGSGLEPEVRKRLFEPYFSTKSSGTGLGLAIVRRAVEAHHGTIDVDSGPEAGTIFRIRLRAASVGVRP